MKIRRFIIIVLFLISLGLVSCQSNQTSNGTHAPAPAPGPGVDYEYDRLTVISVNDTHGTIEESDTNYGVAGLSWYINEQKKERGNAVLVLSAGDMFQGTAISNYNHGLNMINIMNEIGFQAMTLGNHEFDWGLDEALRFVDGNKANGEANFPMLGCNIIEKATNQMPDLVKAYEVVDFGVFQVGVIGYIGVGLEEDIARANVEAYEFVNPTPIVASLASKLRNELGCELVIAMGHDAENATNNQLASLSGDESVDMIINGHTHTTYVRYLTNGNGNNISVSQAGSNISHFTKSLFSFSDNHFSFDTSISVKMTSYDIEPNEKIQKMVKAMQTEIEPIMGEVIGVAGRHVNRTSVSYWTSDQIKEKVGVDLAGVNSGGIRAAAFPIYENDNITIKKMYEIMPFDNTIVTCKLTGQQLANVLIITDIVFSTNVKRIGNTFYIDNEAIDLEKVYSFACPDYLFTRDEEIYEVCSEQEYTAYLVRDVMIEGVRMLNNQKWIDNYYE